MISCSLPCTLQYCVPGGRCSVMLLYLPHPLPKYGRWSPGKDPPGWDNTLLHNLTGQNGGGIPDGKM